MKNKGISLIVLIITIVVIIILATAIIVNIAEANIIGNANEAVVKQDIKTFQDELDLYIADQYANMKGEFDIATVNANTLEEVVKYIASVENSKYEDYIAIANGKVIIKSTMQEPQRTWAMEALNEEKYGIVTVNNVVEGKNATINGENPTYYNPVIPVGFKTINTEESTWTDTNNDGKVDGWNDGLVIEDESGNEYVWIPVDGTNVTYTKWDDERDTVFTANVDKVKDDVLPTGVSSEVYQINKYGGFYVARYEAGIPDEQIEVTKNDLGEESITLENIDSTDIGKAQSKYDKLVWNRISYNNAKIVSENVISTDYVQSGLITGTQWDTILTFLKQEVDVDTRSLEWGNYKNKYGYTINGYYSIIYDDSKYIKGEYTKEAEGYLLLTTGKFGNVVENANPKNIYDVAGNAWEWTTEILTEQSGSNTATDNKVVRGGSCNNSGISFVASFRNGSNAGTSIHSHLGFRFVLYIK